MSDKLDIATRYTHAVVRMLLRQQTLMPGAALLAGGPVDMLKKIELAHLANESRSDIIHLTFDDTADGYSLTGLTSARRATTSSIVTPTANSRSSASGPSSCRRTAAATSCWCPTS